MRRRSLDPDEASSLLFPGYLDCNAFASDIRERVTNARFGFEHAAGKRVRHSRWTSRKSTNDREEDISSLTVRLQVDTEGHLRALNDGNIPKVKRRSNVRVAALERNIHRNFRGLCILGLSGSEIFCCREDACLGESEANVSRPLSCVPADKMQGHCV
jgi:hypothetical protein